MTGVNTAATNHFLCAIRVHIAGRDTDQQHKQHEDGHKARHHKTMHDLCKTLQGKKRPVRRFALLQMCPQN